VFKLCNEAYEEVKKLLEEKKQEVTKLATILMNKETVELDELIEIFGKREGIEQRALSGYLEDLKHKKEGKAT